MLAPRLIIIIIKYMPNIGTESDGKMVKYLNAFGAARCGMRHCLRETKLVDTNMVIQRRNLNPSNYIIKKFFIVAEICPR